MLQGGTEALGNNDQSSGLPHFKFWLCTCLLCALMPLTQFICALVSSSIKWTQ